MRILTFDTTLRDGTQGENVSYSVDDKLAICIKLDELGIDYIEGGWPGSNPKDKEFFARAKSLKLKHSRLTALARRACSKPRRKGRECQRPHRGPNSRRRHLRQKLGPPRPPRPWHHRGSKPRAHLPIPSPTSNSHRREVIYDAEHFFDGYKANPVYALKTLEAAANAGADALVLCDTNGGTLTGQAFRNRLRSPQALHPDHWHPRPQRFRRRRGQFPRRHRVLVPPRPGLLERLWRTLRQCQPLQRHCQPRTQPRPHHHRQRQPPEPHRHLPLPCRAGQSPSRQQPALRRQKRFRPQGRRPRQRHLEGFHHLRARLPGLTGNRQRVLLSDLSGRGNVLYKREERGLGDRLNPEARRELLEAIKDLEYEGYDLEAAEGTFELLVREAIHPGAHFFDVVNFEVSTRSTPNGAPTTASVILKMMDGTTLSASALGDAPVNSLDLCLRQCLSQRHPEISQVRLVDYKVRVLDVKPGPASKVRVLVEWSDNPAPGPLSAVSENVIEASWARPVRRHASRAHAPARFHRRARRRPQGLQLGCITELLPNASVLFSR